MCVRQFMCQVTIEGFILHVFVTSQQHPMYLLFKGGTFFFEPMLWILFYQIVKIIPKYNK